jgi:hypothetical protein
MVLVASLYVAIPLVPRRTTLGTRFSPDPHALSGLPASRLYSQLKVARPLRKPYLHSTTPF